MFKIQPEQIIELYKKNGFTPQQCNSCDKDKNKKCCPLGIIFYENKGYFPDKLPDKIYYFAKELFGEDYMEGFWRAFDKPSLINSLHIIEWRQGIQNGVAVREACDKEFGSCL